MENNVIEKEKPIRIMVVDDSLLIQKLVKKILEPEGFEICAFAINGKQALEMFEQYKPDIITMDINMPVMDGIEAVEQIRSKDKDIKIIIMGSVIDRNILEKANELEIRYFVEKPFEKDKLLEAVNACIEDKNIGPVQRDIKKKETSSIISPFFKALEDIFSCMLSIDGKIDILEEQKDFFETGGYSAVLGFTGKINGWFMLNMSSETAWKVAERINRETYDNKSDAFIGYSVQELANIICGNAVTRLNSTERNLKLRLTPPGLFRGLSMSILVYSPEAYQGIMRTELGDINITVSFE